MRTNMVGTNWAWVTRWRSMAPRHTAASKCSMTTHGAPEAVHGHAVDQRGRVVEGRRGQVHRVPVDAPSPDVRAICTGADSGSPGGPPESSLRTPLGPPVVPDE